MNSVQLNFQNLKAFGIADLTPSTLLDALPHSQLSRNDICFVVGATSTIAQPGIRGSGVQPRTQQVAFFIDFIEVLS
jgi:hypothetical protein